MLVHAEIPVAVHANSGSDDPGDRGVRDLSNEWDMDDLTPTMHTTLRTSTPSGTSTSTQCDSASAEDAEESHILTVMPATFPAGNLASEALNDVPTVEYLIDLDDGAQLDNLCDRTASKSTSKKVHDIVSDPRCTAGVFIQPMAPDDRTSRQASKENMRKAAAILLGL